MAAAGRLLQPLLRTFSAQTRQLSAAAHGEPHQAARTWKILSFVVALPAVGVCMLNTYLKMQHHSHDRRSLSPTHTCRFAASPSPGGDGNHSLFHNSHVNALPTGYEGGEH